METNRHNPYKSPISFTFPVKHKKPFDQLKINIEGVKKAAFKPLKVGIRKLPGDFFGRKLDIRIKKPECLTEPMNHRVTVNKEQKNEQNRRENGANHEQILPEAQVTSFFKMAHSPCYPDEIEQYRNQRRLSENKTSKNIQTDESNLVKTIHMQSNPSLNDLYTTFSKKLISLKEVEVTQEKYKAFMENQFEGNNIVRSVQMKRPSKEIASQQEPKTSFMKERVKKYSFLQPPRQYSLGDTLAKNKKNSQPLNLPNIYRIQ